MDWCVVSQPYYKTSVYKSVLLLEPAAGLSYVSLTCIILGKHSQSGADNEDDGPYRTLVEENAQEAPIR